MPAFKINIAAFAVFGSILSGIVSHSHAAPFNESTPPLSPDSTVLNLNATGTVHAFPDKLVAIVTVEEQGKDTVSIQNHVNEVIQKAVQSLKHAKSLQLNVQNYSVYKTQTGTLHDRDSVWVARQSIQLTSSSQEELLNHVKNLQNIGLVLSSLEWQFSLQKQQELQDSAEILAIKNLKNRISTIAQALGKKVGVIKQINIGENMRPIRPFSLMASPSSMVQEKSAALPQVSNEEQDITATISGVVVLTP